jgi:hypothetical protein
MVKIVKFLLLFVIAGSSISATWYVDNQATGNNDGTSWESAWQSFATINWNLINGGDTIFISGGPSLKTYNEQLTINRSGTSGNPIVIKKGEDSGHNGTVLIDGDYTRYGILSDGNSHLTIQNIDCDRNTQCLRIRNGSHIIVENIRANLQRGKGIRFGYISYGLIKDCRITTDVGSFNYQTDGIYLQYGNNNVVNKNHIVINNNHASPHSDGIQLYQETNPTISNNYIEQTGTIPEDNNGIWSSTCSGSYTIYNNIIYTPHFHTWANTFGYLEYATNASLRIYNNTFIGGSSPNVLMIDDPDAIIKNNIFVGNYAGRGVYLGNGLTNNGNLDHNLYGFLNSSGDIVYFSGQGNCNMSQLNSIGAEGSGIDRNNPLFENINNRDFSLLSGSPAINAGVDLGSPFNRDKNGVARPQGNGWDLGAYEFDGPANLPPLTPNILRIKE